ncbi:MAG: hypothetical protein V7776_23600 [Halopseudomonas aestusnigri]
MILKGGGVKKQITPLIEPYSTATGFAKFLGWSKFVGLKLGRDVLVIGSPVNVCLYKNLTSVIDKRYHHPNQ